MARRVLPPAGRSGGSEKAVDVGVEPFGEEHHRGDPGGLHGGDHPIGLGEAQREGLVQQQVPAGGGGPYGDLGLHVRGQRHGHRVTGVEQRVDVVERRYPVPGGQRGGPVRVTSPDTDQFGARMRVQPGAVRLRRPVTGAEQAEPQHEVPPVSSGHARSWP